MQTGELAPLTPSVLSKALGISMPYASQILSDNAKINRPPKVPLAIRIYRATGHKLGPIAEATDDEIGNLEKHLEALEKFQGAA